VLCGFSTDANQVVRLPQHWKSGYVVSPAPRWIQLALRPRKNVLRKTATWPLSDFYDILWMFIFCLLKPNWLLLLCRALVDREGSSYYYLPLTPRVSLPPPLQSAIQFCMSIYDIEVRSIDVKYRISNSIHCIDISKYWYKLEHPDCWCSAILHHRDNTHRMRSRKRYLHYAIILSLFYI